VQQLGGSVLGAPADIANVGRFATVADPQGAALNLFKPARPGERAISREPGHVAWHELHTNDWPKAFDFYSRLFGWVKGDAMDMGAIGAYQMFNAGATAIGGMFNNPVAREARFWLYYFSVGDIDAAATRIVDGGGSVAQGPSQVPGGGWIIHAVDPQGAAFGLLGSRA
jgi:predicted enzyme related to lactoylglutathione lyase